MTESETIARTEIDRTALAETVREALAQLKSVEERLQIVLEALGQTSAQAPAAAPTEPLPATPSQPEQAAPPEAAEPGAVDTVAWEVAAEDMEIPITHPSRFQPGQTIAIGDGPTREVARIRTIMGTRLLCVRGIDDTSAQHHDRGRNIYIVK